MWPPGDLPRQWIGCQCARWGSPVGKKYLRGDCRLEAPWLLFLRVSSSPRLATSEAPDAMEEWDVPQMKKEVESLKYQLAFKREMSSKTIPE